MAFDNFIGGKRIFQSVCTGSDKCEITTWQPNTVDIWILSKPLFSKAITETFLGPALKYFVALVFKNHVSIMPTM